MKLKIQKTTEEEIEIPIPSFWSFPSLLGTAFIGILSEDDCISIKKSSNYTDVMRSRFETIWDRQQILKGKQISKDEFTHELEISITTISVFGSDLV